MFYRNYFSIIKNITRGYVARGYVPARYCLRDIVYAVLSTRLCPETNHIISILFDSLFLCT